MKNTLINNSGAVVQGQDYAGLFLSLWDLIGNTPMIKISYRYKGGVSSIYAKCEFYNLTGSIKDRMALYILQQAWFTGQLLPGNKVVEASSGNSGISFAAIGKALGHSVHIFMPDWLSRERVNIIRSLGAEITSISQKEGGFVGSIRACEHMAENGNVFLPRQFDNVYNIEAHARTTGKEIGEQLRSTRLVADAFVAGVGTGGTVMGVAKHLGKSNSRIVINAIEPAESPTLSTGYKVGTHRIQGISDEFIPSIVNPEAFSNIIKIHDGDAILMAQKLAAELGLGIGISSGANLLGAICTQQQLGPDSVVVTVFPDSNKKYLSTDLMKEEPVESKYLTPKIELLGYSSIATK